MLQITYDRTTFATRFAALTGACETLEARFGPQVKLWINIAESTYTQWRIAYAVLKKAATNEAPELRALQYEALRRVLNPDPAAKDLRLVPASDDELIDAYNGRLDEILLGQSLFAPEIEPGDYPSAEISFVSERETRRE